ncbi:MAG: hypothetical protein GTO71_06620 [Woeseiaceae bacterium]|nr:hypothetical protein [Woeseiaceae bacterium]NIP20769.1 hypothetical protein [Woeseiaceae bacterium]NIS89562.1 hypothetical protein [Woeseiaceae bacterium]
MLGRPQQQLNETYQADVGHDVRDYLITDPKLARILSGNNVLTAGAESLLVCEDNDGLAMSLYLDDELLDRVRKTDPAQQLADDQLDDLCKVIEGLSHFMYVAWRANKDQCMTLLELELQAEVDKYVSTIQIALEQGDNDLLHSLHGRLFDQCRFRDDLDHEQLERYRAASEYAARFCRRLRRRLVHGGDEALDELRRSYRMPLADKISHIHARSWGHA